LRALLKAILGVLSRLVEEDIGNLEGLLNPL